MATPPYDVPTACTHLARKDRTLAALMRDVGPCRLAIAARQAPYEALLESIVYQQLNGKAAAAIHGRLCAHFGRKRSPTPAELATATVEKLKSVGLSTAKANAALDLARHALAGEIPSRSEAKRLSDDELVEQLTAVRGIGRWTVEMLLIFSLGRPDVLPIDDYGIKKGFARAYRRSVLPKPNELSAHGERWRPYRSVASWYLWRSADLG